MPNYQNGKVYSIRSLSRPELIYVGSTTQTLSMRMTQHRTPSSTCVSREIINIGDAYIELIENYPCNDKNQLLARENRHMRGLECLNKRLGIADCPHGRIQNYCVECHGSGICIHNKQKSHCIPCGGSSVCIHNKQKYHCIPCGGSSMCIHNKQKQHCIPCGGSSVCIHNKQKQQCIPCGGSSVCIHNKKKQQCIICSPITCETCNITISKGSYAKHLNSRTHIDNIDNISPENIVI